MVAVGPVVGGRPQPFPVTAGARPENGRDRRPNAAQRRQGVPGFEADRGHIHSSERRQPDRDLPGGCLQRLHLQPLGRNLLLARLPEVPRRYAPVSWIDRLPYPVELMEHVPPCHLHRERGRIVGANLAGRGDRRWRPEGRSQKRDNHEPRPQSLGEEDKIRARCLRLVEPREDAVAIHDVLSWAKASLMLATQSRKPAYQARRWRRIAFDGAAVSGQPFSAGNKGATRPTETGRNAGVVEDANPAQIQIGRTRPKLGGPLVISQETALTPWRTADTFTCGGQSKE